MIENQRQYLDFIQNAITRMNSNSCQLKSLTITIVAAFLALYISLSNIIIIFAGIIPVLLFGCLDAYYLQLERKYRALYNDAAGIQIPPLQKNLIYNMDISRYKGNKLDYWSAINSPSIKWLYLTMFLLLSLVGIFIYFGINNG